MLSSKKQRNGYEGETGPAGFPFGGSYSSNEGHLGPAGFPFGGSYSSKMKTFSSNEGPIGHRGISDEEFLLYQEGGFLPYQDLLYQEEELIRKKEQQLKTYLQNKEVILKKEQEEYVSETIPLMEECTTGEYITNYELYKGDLVYEVGLEVSLYAELNKIKSRSSFTKEFDVSKTRFDDVNMTYNTVVTKKKAEGLQFELIEPIYMKGGEFYKERSKREIDYSRPTSYFYTNNIKRSKKSSLPYLNYCNNKPTQHYDSQTMTNTLKTKTIYIKPALKCDRKFVEALVMTMVDVVEHYIGNSDFGNEIHQNKKFLNNLRYPDGHPLNTSKEISHSNINYWEKDKHIMIVTNTNFINAYLEESHNYPRFIAVRLLTVLGVTFNFNKENVDPVKVLKDIIRSGVRSKYVMRCGEDVARIIMRHNFNTLKTFSLNDFPDNLFTDDKWFAAQKGLIDEYVSLHDMKVKDVNLKIENMKSKNTEQIRGIERKCKLKIDRLNTDTLWHFEHTDQNNEQINKLMDRKEKSILKRNIRLNDETTNILKTIPKFIISLPLECGRITINSVNIIRYVHQKGLINIECIKNYILEHTQYHGVNFIINNILALLDWNIVEQYLRSEIKYINKYGEKKEEIIISLREKIVNIPFINSDVIKNVKIFTKQLCEEKIAESCCICEGIWDKFNENFHSSKCYNCGKNTSKDLKEKIEKESCCTCEGTWDKYHETLTSGKCYNCGKSTSKDLMEKTKKEFRSTECCNCEKTVSKDSIKKIDSNECYNCGKSTSKDLRKKIEKEFYIPFPQLNLKYRDDSPFEVEGQFHLKFNIIMSTCTLKDFKSLLKSKRINEDDFQYICANYYEKFYPDFKPVLYYIIPIMLKQKIGIWSVFSLDCVKIIENEYVQVMMSNEISSSETGFGRVKLMNKFRNIRDRFLYKLTYVLIKNIKTIPSPCYNYLVSKYRLTQTQVNKLYYNKMYLNIISLLPYYNAIPGAIRDNNSNKLSYEKRYTKIENSSENKNVNSSSDSSNNIKSSKKASDKKLDLNDKDFHLISLDFPGNLKIYLRGKFWVPSKYHVDYQIVAGCYEVYSFRNQIADSCFQIWMNLLPINKLSDIDNFFESNKEIYFKDGNKRNIVDRFKLSEEEKLIYCNMDKNITLLDEQNKKLINILHQVRDFTEKYIPPYATKYIILLLTLSDKCKIHFSEYGYYDIKRYWPQPVVYHINYLSKLIKVREPTPEGWTSWNFDSRDPDSMKTIMKDEYLSMRNRLQHELDELCSLPDHIENKAKQ